MEVIQVKNLTKDYIIDKKKNGLKGAFTGLFIKKKEVIHAVEDISFSIGQGDIVGFIGPNGSGKSTTIKMMSGILQPTTGSVIINGMSPQKERKKVVRDLGVVFGQRSQLFWDLRLGESFELIKRIYRIEEHVYQENLALMEEMLGIHEIIEKPVRMMSLGQRMKGDLAAAVLHSPSIIFLDEPTIGLDIDAKQSIRKFIRDINRTRKTTIILTTHDLDDIRELCERIIIINKGKIIEDGSLNNIIEKISPFRRLIVDLYEEHPELTHKTASIVKNEGARVCFEFNKSEMSASQLIADISDMVEVQDISLEEPDIEDIIKTIYHSTKETIQT